MDDNSPAAAAKLRAGDIITSMDGKDRRDSRALMRAIIETPAGTTARLGVWRNGKQEVVPVALAALPAGWTLPEYLSGGGVAKPDLPPEALVNFGLQLSAITPELRAQYKLAATQPGVLVTGVAIGSEAANIGIDAGAVIVRVRDATVATPEDLVQRVADERQQNRGIHARPAVQQWRAELGEFPRQRKGRGLTPLTRQRPRADRKLFSGI